MPVVLLDVSSQRVLAALPPPCMAHDAIQHLGFLADGVHLVSIEASGSCPPLLASQCRPALPAPVPASVQAVQWAGGSAVYNLLTCRPTWVVQLPTTLLAVDQQSARLALGVHGSAVVCMDAAGRLQQGVGLLHGLGVQAAQFYGEHVDDAAQVRRRGGVGSGPRLALLCARCTFRRD